MALVYRDTHIGGVLVYGNTAYAASPSVAPGATLTGTSSIAAGSATGSAAGTAPGASLHGTSSIAAGTASGTVSASAMALGAAMVGTSSISAGAASGEASSQPAAQLTPAHKMYSGTNRNRFYAAGSGKNFSPKRSIEREVFTVDFADILPDGDSIASAAWSSTPVDGQDATASSMIQGDASRDGSMVSQMIVGGVPGLTYAPICTAQTVLGETLVLPEYGFGLLYISG